FDGVLDVGEGHGDLSYSAECVASSRSTYFAKTSTSRLTGSPGALVPSVVTASVCGMTATSKLPAASSRDATVRLMPSTVIEPFSTRYLRIPSRHPPRGADDATELVAKVMRVEPSGSGARRARVPTASTWPWTT